MKSSGWLGALLTVALIAPSGASGGPLRGDSLDRVNARLHGHVIDFTHHHGADRRIWSEALHQCRDLYVYVPPCFDPAKCYPIMLWFHGFMQDEQEFLNDVAVPLDRAMADGALPPMIVAAPDGTLKGRASLLGGNSFFINSKSGNFEDYIIHDVWPFLLQHFPICPEREAHVLAGVSMGGFAAYNLSIKHQDLFKVVIGIYPPLNLRWVDCHDRYYRNFDPCCWGWRSDASRGREVVGRFVLGLVRIRARKLVDPLFDRDVAVERMSEENPAEMILRGQLRPGDLDLFVAYGGKDEFNLDAQIESFLYLARAHGICVEVYYERRGRHDTATALRAVPSMIHWLTPLIAPYSPN